MAVASLAALNDPAADVMPASRSRRRGACALWSWRRPTIGSSRCRRYNIASDPAQLEIGNLTDDWDFVPGVLRGRAQPVAYQLTEVAPLLDYVGQALAGELTPKGG